MDMIVPGRGLSEVVERGRRRRNTGEEVNLSETSLELAKTLRRVRRSSVNEDEYGDYPDYDSEQDYPASNTNYEDTPEVTMLALPGALVVELFRNIPSRLESLSVQY